jgi:hypothetical protein
VHHYSSLALQVMRGGPGSLGVLHGFGCVAPAPALTTAAPRALLCAGTGSTTRTSTPHAWGACPAAQACGCSTPCGSQW